MNETRAVAYKVLTAAEFAAFETEGRFDGSPLDLADGFVHMSAAAQVRPTVDRHFAGANDLVVAAIDLSMLGDSVRWENSRDGALFPHVYAALPFAAVIAASPLRRDVKGAVLLPA